MANNNIGWISLHRQIQNHWIWEDANKLKWWIDMLLTVNSNPAKVNIGNEIYDCQRGESLISLQGWASRWNISKDTARNFIRLLEKDNMIKCVSIGKSTRITICNYDSYQQPLHVKQTDVVRKANAKQTQTNPNNKEDNENKIFSDLPLEEKLSELTIAYNAFYEMRKLKKKPATDHAKVVLKKRLLELSLGDDKKAVEILNQSIINGWVDVFPLKPNNDKKFTPSNNSHIAN